MWNNEFWRSLEFLLNFYSDISSHCTCSFLMLLAQRVLHIRPQLTAKDREDVWRKLTNHMHSFWVSLAAIIPKLTVGQLKLLTKILTRYAGKRTWEAMNLYAYTSKNLFCLRMHFHLSYSSCSKQQSIIIFTMWSCELQCSDERLIFNQGELHLLASDGMEFCLDASPRKKRTSKEFKSGSFSPCRSDANQVSLHSQFPSI